MELYLVRHGETSWNVKKIFQGQTDIPLNEKGRQAAREEGRRLENVHFDVIYSSPLQRAYETACLIRGAKEVPIVRDDRLKEISFGSKEGENIQSFLDEKSGPCRFFYTKPELYEPPTGGETLEQLRQRTASFLRQEIEDKQRTYSHGTLLHTEPYRVMIVGHGASNTGLLCHMMGYSVEDFWKGGMLPNCGAMILTYQDGRYSEMDSKYQGKADNIN